MTKAVAYERVSYADQTKGYSLETQRLAREEYSSKHGIEIVASFVGQESAFTPGSPVSVPTHGALIGGTKKSNVRICPSPRDVR